VALEIMDSMFKPEEYGPVYLGSFFYIFSLTLPHSIAANLAYPVKASPSNLSAEWQILPVLRIHQ
jgi:hypothetical protein